MEDEESDDDEDESLVEDELLESLEGVLGDDSEDDSPDDAFVLMP